MQLMPPSHSPLGYSEDRTWGRTHRMDLRGNPSSRLQIFILKRTDSKWTKFALFRRIYI